jgi:hypothetical protein
MDHVLLFRCYYDTTSKAIVEQLAEAKDVTTNHKTIKFDYVNFDDDVASATVDFFRDLSEKDCVVPELQLTTCRGRVGDALQEAKAFAEILIDDLHSDQEGEELLLPILPAICMGMRCHPHLKKVDLGTMLISAREARVLGQGLKTAGSHFKELSLRVGPHCCILDKGGIYSELAAGLRYNSSLEILSLESCCDIKDVQLGWIADALVHNPSLKELSLSGRIDFGPQGLAALAKLLKKNSSLESLSLHSHKRGLGTHIKILAEALEGNQNLKKLNLLRTKIGDVGLDIMTSILCTCPTRLEELNIRGNRISDEGLEAFASRPISSCLRRLYVDILSDGDANRHLLEALQLNPHLGEIGYSYYQFPPDVRHLLDLNWCGRVILGKNSTTVPLSIWPVVLERANAAAFSRHDEISNPHAFKGSNQEERRANAIFHLLQGPALMQRRFDSVGVSVLGEKRSAENTTSIPPRTRDKRHK